MPSPCFMTSPRLMIWPGDMALSEHYTTLASEGSCLSSLKNSWLIDTSKCEWVPHCLWGHHTGQCTQLHLLHCCHKHHYLCRPSYSRISPIRRRPNHLLYRILHKNDPMPAATSYQLFAILEPKEWLTILWCQDSFHAHLQETQLHLT